MLPRAPYQTYVDVYLEEDKPGCSFADERKRQSDYEAEVKVFRALEGLKENLMVLHGLQYTHNQYCLCVKSHLRDKRNCKGCKSPYNKEGECDFLVLGPDYCVIIEVKNMSHVEQELADPKLMNAVVGTFRKSLVQREKISALIKGINVDTTVLQFTAYPNFSKKCKDQFQSCEETVSPLTNPELSTIIFQEDITGFISRRSTEQPNSTGKGFSPILCCLSDCFRRTNNIDENSASTAEEISRFSVWWEENVTQTLISARRTDEGGKSSTDIERYEKPGIYC